jgi:hypothetical protein
MSVSPYLGSNVDLVSVRELLYRGLLQEGETLLALFDGVLIDERGRRVGGVSLTDFIALTDQRLVTWARGFFNDTVDAFPWKDVDVVEARTWDPLHGSVSLAFRLQPSAPRPRRIAVKGYRQSHQPQESGEQIVINSVDYMPASDVPVFTDMVGWIGDQVVAGITDEELFASFADTFDLPEVEPEPKMEPQQPQQPKYQEPAPEPQPEKRSWWGFGRKREQEEYEMPQQHQPNDLADAPDKLIAAYEMQRSGAPEGYEDFHSMPQRGSRGVPTALGRFGFYDVSRGMRLLFEGPRRMGGSINRVNDMLLDTAEVIEELHDPKARRRTLSGLRMAMDMQEQQSGLLGAVAPVVRAVLGSEDSGGEGQSSSRGRGGGRQGGERAGRRIQVRASVRQRNTEPETGPTMRMDQQSEQPDSSDSDEEERYSSRREGNRVPVVNSKAKVRRQVVSRQTESTGESNGYEPARSYDSEDSAADSETISDEG